MDVTRDGNRIYVRLSKRNATQLIQACEQGFAAGIHRLCENGDVLHVVVEDDAAHYGARQIGPGLDRVLTPRGTGG